MSTQKDRKLMDGFRDVMRLRHYSIHTERSYCDWIKRYILFHGMTSRDDLNDGEAKIEQFLTHLAVDGHVSPSTRNQAMNALVFLYKKVLNRELDGKIDAVREKTKLNVPVVMTREEVKRVIGLMTGTPQLVTIVIQLWFFLARFMHKLFRIFQRATISVHAHNLLHCSKIEMLLPGISCIPYNTSLLRVFLWQNARTSQLNSS